MKLELQGMGETTARKRRKGETLYARNEIGRLRDPNDNSDIVFYYDPIDNLYFARKRDLNDHTKPDTKIGTKEELLERLRKVYSEDEINNLDLSD